jgi:hypothetical protein
VGALGHQLLAQRHQAAPGLRREADRQLGVRLRGCVVGVDQAGFRFGGATVWAGIVPLSGTDPAQTAAWDESPAALLLTPASCT